MEGDLTKAIINPWTQFGVMGSAVIALAVALYKVAGRLMASQEARIAMAEKYGERLADNSTAMRPPRRATYIGFRQNYTVQNQSQLATSVTQVDAAIYGAPVRFSTAFDQWTANAYPGAVVVYIAHTGYRDHGAGPGP